MADSSCVSKRNEEKTDNSKKLTNYTLPQLRPEVEKGLKLYAETAWGWSELKVGAFLKALEKSRTTIVGYTEIRKNGALSIRLPRRV